MRKLFGGSREMAHSPGVASDGHRGSMALGPAGASAYVGGTPIPYSASTVTVNGVPPWMPALWEYYDATGEMHFAANFLAACLSRCTLRLGVVDQDNNIGPAFDEDGNPMKGVDAELAEYGASLISGLRTVPGVEAKGPIGGQAMLLSRIGANLGAVADCYLIATDRPAGMTWEVVSRLEMWPADTPRGQKQRFHRRVSRTQTATYETFTPDFWLRIYRPHPAFSQEADSSNTPLLGVLERLVLLTAEGVADSKSRLKGPGVYWVPSEIDFPGTDDDPDGDNYLTNEFIRTASLAIKDPAAASRHVPIVIRAAGEQIENIRHDKFGYDDDRLQDKRQAAVGDFARGTDLPYESTVGMSSTSFANAFQIDEQLARLHVVPWLELVTGFLTGGFLTGMLMQKKGLKAADPPPPEVARFVVWHDIAGLVTHPNPEKTVQFAYGTEANPNFLISARGARRMSGIPEADRPDDDEIAERSERSHKLRMRSEIGGDKGIDGDDGDPTPEDTTPEGTDVDEEIGKRVLSMSELAVAAAVDKAGAKLRSKVAGRPELARRINGIDNADVARTLGPQCVEDLGGASTLIVGAFNAFSRTVLASCMEAGRDDAADLAGAAVKMVESVTLARLFSPSVRLDARMAQGFLNLLINGNGKESP